MAWRRARFNRVDRQGCSQRARRMAGNCRRRAAVRRGCWPLRSGEEGVNGVCVGESGAISRVASIACVVLSTMEATEPTEPHGSPSARSFTELVRTRYNCSSGPFFLAFCGCRGRPSSSSSRTSFIKSRLIDHEAPPADPAASSTSCGSDWRRDARRRHCDTISPAQRASE